MLLSMTLRGVSDDDDGNDDVDAVGCIMDIAMLVAWTCCCWTSCCCGIEFVSQQVVSEDDSALPAPIAVSPSAAAMTNQECGSLEWSAPPSVCSASVVASAAVTETEDDDNAKLRGGLVARDRLSCCSTAD